MKFQKVKKAEMSILNLFSRKHDRNNLFTDIFLIGYFSDISRAASAEGTSQLGYTQFERNPYLYYRVS